MALVSFLARFQEMYSQENCIPRKRGLANLLREPARRQKSSRCGLNFSIYRTRDVGFPDFMEIDMAHSGGWEIGDWGNLYHEKYLTFWLVPRSSLLDDSHRLQYVLKQAASRRLRRENISTRATENDDQAEAPPQARPSHP